MTAEVEEFLDEIRQYLKADLELIAEGEVLSVDAEKLVCEVLVDGFEYAITGVRLQAAQGGKATVVMLPKVKSRVVVMKLGTAWSKAMVLQYSEVDEVRYTAGNKSLLVKDAAVELNGGAIGGMVVVDKLLVKLNAVEQLLNQVLLAFNTHTHIVAGVPSAIPNNPITSTPVAITSATDIENKEVLQ